MPRGSVFFCPLGDECPDGWGRGRKYKSGTAQVYERWNGSIRAERRKYKNVNLIPGSVRPDVKDWSSLTVSWDHLDSQSVSRNNWGNLNNYLRI